MISTWQFITPPNGISMSADLMPLRQSGDETRYGIDTAWLWEVLSVWQDLQHRVLSSSCNMSINPTASEMNAIRTLATNIKTYQLSPNSLQPIFDSAMQTASFAALSALSSIKVAFGTVPANVASGDTVELSHVSDMFDWMEDVVCVHKTASFTPSISSWTPTHGEDGSGTYYPEWMGSDCLLLWDWTYTDLSGGAWAHLSGGAWQRQVADDFVVSVTISNMKAIWFSSAKLFVEVKAGSYSDGYVNAYIPIGTASITQSGTSIVVSVTCEGSAAVTSAKTATGTSEVPYSTSGTGSGRLEIKLTGNAVCFLELAADYRYPTSQS